MKRIITGKNGFNDHFRWIIFTSCILTLGKSIADITSQKANALVLNEKVMIDTLHYSKTEAYNHMARAIRIQHYNCSAKPVVLT